jgi:hypothetical protein
MGKIIHLGGMRFGRWTVVALLPRRRRRKNGQGEAYWLCRCICDGTERAVLGTNLRSGRSQSCGCIQREKIGALRRTHGRSNTRAFRIWLSMLQRCYNSNCRDYPNYGGRGIAVCERWHSFVNFLADMGEPPLGMSIDRKNNDGDYTPDNCQWATPAMQRANQRPRKRRRQRATLAELQAYTDALARAAAPGEVGRGATTVARINSSIQRAADGLDELQL